jgi:hypothetical protein
MYCCSRLEAWPIKQDGSNTWSAHSISVTNLNSTVVEFMLEADVYIEHSLESLMNMSESVVDLFENGKFTDLILSVQETKFRCHKAMLMEKSPVFLAMVTQKYIQNSHHYPS